MQMQRLDGLAEAFARSSNALPGETAAEHRKLMAQVFAQLEQILPALKGPNRGAEFNEQLEVIRESRAELATGPQDLPPEPSIDTGLRAARDALWEMARNDYYDASVLRPMFDRLSAKIDELDTVRGPLHQVATGEAVGLTSQIVSNMAETLNKQQAASTGSGQAASTSSGQARPNPTSAPATRRASSEAAGK